MTLEQIKQTYDIVGEVNLDHWHDLSYAEARDWLIEQCQKLYKQEYQPNERLLFTHCRGDYYVQGQTIGLITRNLQVIIDEQKISNWFVIVASTNPDMQQELISVGKNSLCDEPISSDVLPGEWHRIDLKRSPSTVNELYKYGSVNPLKISLSELTEKENFLLSDSKIFCIYPWIHLNANPDGQAYPCCMTDHAYPVGDCKSNTLKEIWNGNKMKQVRLDMLTETETTGCNRCYEQEQSGFFSGRQSANKHHGHHIGRVSETKSDGTLDKFEMIYWDIRFSNLCNLRCRSCGHIYSSQWYQDQAKLAGPEWAKNNRVLNYAGRHETDMWEQLVSHIDHVEQIYFAGGEPLIMEEHYRILEELERKQRFDVRLIYNSNFTEVKLKDRLVFDYWKKFDSVSVGASLDGMDARGEYIRKGTRWQQVEENRQHMLEICPDVDFYVSSTLSIFNAWHLPDFHRNWTERGLIKAQDWNVNILLDPEQYRIDVAPKHYKEELCAKLREHIEWLKPQDRLGRATQGYESAVNFLMANDNSFLLPKFKQRSQELDRIRGENLLEILPELQALYNENTTR
jgi:radical SAM protein with 4Fe4S-binding SPASM domain